MHRLLIVDDEFKCLSIPMSGDKYAELDLKIRKNLSSPPVIVWNDYILDGFEAHLLYEKYHRFYTVAPLFFSRREQAVAWSCRHQLERKDLNQNAIAWLLYRLYLAEEKAEARKSAAEDFQYRQLSPSLRASDKTENDTLSYATIVKISEEFKICSATMRRYATFGRRLDIMEKRHPGVRLRILTGSLDVARANMEALLNMPPDILQKMIDDPHCSQLIPLKVSYSRHDEERKSSRKHTPPLIIGIKNMPAFDPDAELNGLAFTARSWKSALEKIMAQTDFKVSSPAAKHLLRNVLVELTAEIETMNHLLEVHTND